jgi:uncharacterized membrane protein
VTRLCSALALILLVGCGQINTLNSVSSDRGRYSLDGSANFLAAKEILSAKCESCHPGLVEQSEDWWATDSVFDMATGNITLVVPGNAEGSALFKSLQLNGVAGSRADMPLGGTMTSAEVQVFRDWINSL